MNILLCICGQDGWADCECGKTFSFDTSKQKNVTGPWTVDVDRYKWSVVCPHCGLTAEMRETRRDAVGLATRLAG